LHTASRLDGLDECRVCALEQGQEVELRKRAEFPGACGCGCMRRHNEGGLEVIGAEICRRFLSLRKTANLLVLMMLAFRILISVIAFNGQPYDRSESLQRGSGEPNLLCECYSKYDAAFEDPIIAASMRAQLVDLLIPQDYNRGSKVSIVRPPVGAHIITNTLATKKKYDTNGNFDRPVFVLMASDRFLKLTLIPMELQLLH